MNRALLPRLTEWLARPEIAEHDPSAIAALREALAGEDPPVVAGRHGNLVCFAPGPRRRRLLELDRRGQLVAACTWTATGLARAQCRLPDGGWVGIESGGGEHAAWGRSDRVWRLGAAMPWTPLEPLTVFEALDYDHLDVIPALAEPHRLPAGAGTAILNLLAGFMKDQGRARVRYRGPYPTEALFTALLECFRYDPGATDPLARFLDGSGLDWMPAPHERHEVAPGITVQLRQEIEKVVLRGVPFYRPDWQGVLRREPRRVRLADDRAICSLWALGQSIEDRLVLDRAGEVLAAPAAAASTRAAAPLPPVWRPALAALIARESAPPLTRALGEALDTVALEWGPVPGDLVAIDGDRIRLSDRLHERGREHVRAAAPEARPERAAEFALDVARLLAPAMRLRAQLHLAALPEAEQRRRLEEVTPAGSGESIGRLLALVVGGHG